MFIRCLGLTRKSLSFAIQTKARVYSNYLTTEDLSYRYGKDINDRAYYGSIEKNLPQEMRDEYSKLKTLKQKTAFKMKEAARRLMGYV
jgi:hypothetical protein